jgi:hypothetical protein
MPRPARPMYVKKTTVYLTDEQRQAARDIQADLPVARPGDEAPALIDQIGYALLDTAKTLRRERAVKK